MFKDNQLFWDFRVKVRIVMWIFTIICLQFKLKLFFVVLKPLWMIHF